MLRRFSLAIWVVLALALFFALRARERAAPVSEPGIPAAPASDPPGGEQLDGLVAGSAAPRQVAGSAPTAPSRGPRRLRVVDHASGHAVPGASLSLLRTAQFDRSHPDERRLYSFRPMTRDYPNLVVLDEVVVARSDAEGWVPIDGLADGRYFARQAGYAAQCLTLRREGFEDESAEVRIELFPSASLAVHTASADGAPLRGVFLGLTCIDAGLPLEGNSQLRPAVAGLDQEPMVLGSMRGMAGPSDDQGLAHIEGVPCAHEYTLFATSGARGSQPRVVVGCGTDLEVSLSASAAGTIRGQILAGGSSSNQHGGVLATTRGEVIPRNCQVRSDGTFELTEVPAGRVRVLLERTGVAPFEIDLAPGEVRDLGQIRCPERVTVSGQVLACPNEPLEALQVLVQDSLGGWPQYDRPDAEGKFNLQVPKVAQRIALVRVGGNGPQILLEQPLEKYEDILLDARGSCATLRIACEGVAEGTMVQARLLGADSPADVRRNREPHALSLGSFTVAGGELRIPVGARGAFELYLISEPAVGAWVRDLVIAGPGEIDLGTLHFGSATLVTWVPGDAPPLPGAIVARSPVLGTYPISLAGNESTQIESKLAPGRWVLGAGEKSDACATEQAFELQVGERRTIQCQLGAGGSIRGSLRTPDAACTDEIVKLYDLKRRENPREVRTDAGGRFSFERLREGAWLLSTGALGDGPRLRVELGCGEERQVALVRESLEVPVRFTRSGELLPIARAIAVDLDAESETFGCERSGKRGSDGRWLLQLSGKRVLLRAADSWHFPKYYDWIGDPGVLRRTGTAELAQGSLELDLSQLSVLAERPEVYLASTSDGVDLTRLCPEPLVDLEAGPGKWIVPGVPAGVKLLLSGRAPDGALRIRELDAPSGGVLRLVWP